MGKGPDRGEGQEREGGREEPEMSGGWGWGAELHGELGWGLGWPSPCHARWSLTHHQAVHPQLQTHAQPPLASFF